MSKYNFFEDPAPASKETTTAPSKSTVRAEKATKPKVPVISPFVLQMMFSLASKYASTKKQRWVEGCTEEDYLNWVQVRDAWAKYKEEMEK